MKRAASITIALLLATTLVYAALPVSPTTQVTGTATDTANDTTAVCSAAVSASPASGTENGVYVDFTYSYDIDSTLGSYASIEISWNAGVAWEEAHKITWLSSGVSTGSARHPAAGLEKNSQIVDDIEIRACANHYGSSGQTDSTMTPSWSIEQDTSGRRRIIVVNTN
jgi:hypothetical protein